MQVRDVIEADAPAIETIYKPVVLETAISFEWEPPTERAWRERIAKIAVKYPWLVAVDDAHQVRGFVYAASHRAPRATSGR